MLKKITSLLLSVAMLLTLTTPSMAASLEETEAAITEVIQPPEPPMEAPPAPLVEENNYAELSAAGQNPSGTCGANLTWELNTANETLTISGTGAMYDYYYNNYAPWYSYRSHMKTLILEEGITTIGWCAFSGCSGLTGSLTLPTGLTTIGWCAFSGCSGLTGSLTLPSGLTKIGSNAFDGCSGLTGSLTLPSGVTSIGILAFQNCSGLTGSLTLPTGLTTIGDGAFVRTQLSSVQVSPENPNYSSSTDGVLFNKDKTALIYYPIGKKGAYSIPDGVTTIVDSAFDGCSDLTGSLTLPSGVTTIGEWAFNGCSGLTGSLTLPSGLTSIGKSAFQYCRGLTGSLTLPSGVTSIGQWAFYGCSGLTGSLTLPSGLTTIESGAFEYCSGLTGSLTLPSGVTSIGYYAFSGCSGLTGSLTLPSGLTKIDHYAFSGCSGLTGSLTLPNGLTSIGSSAFDGCSGLTSAYFRGNAPQVYSASDSPSFPPNLPLYYDPATTGWSTPTWMGYQTAPRNNGGTSGGGNGYVPSASTIAIKGTHEVESLPELNAPTYQNTILKKDTVKQNYDIKSGNITVGAGNVTVYEKLVVENATLTIEKGRSVSAGDLEIGANGRVIVYGTLHVNGQVTLRGGNDKNQDAGGYLDICSESKVIAGGITLKEYSYMYLEGKLDTGDFTIQTRSNKSLFRAKASMVVSGDFRQRTTGVLFWKGGQNNFMPEDGFNLILKSSTTQHMVKFDSPKESFLYNLYLDKGEKEDQPNDWKGNPTIKGQIKSVYTKNGVYKILVTKDDQEATKYMKTVRNEVLGAVNNKYSAYIGFGIDGFEYETNKAIQTYLYSYISAIPVIYSKIDKMQQATWSQEIPVTNRKKTERVKFDFKLRGVLGSRGVDVNYTYNGKSGYFGCFLSTDAKKVGDILQEYVRDTYKKQISLLLSAPLNILSDNKQFCVAEILWQCISKKVDKYINVPLNEYTENIGKKIKKGKTLAMSASTMQNTLPQKIETVPAIVQNFATPTTDLYLEKALKQALNLGENDLLTPELLSTVKTLDLSEKYISDISLLSGCTNLQTLHLQGNAVGDLTALTHLNALTELDLSGNIVRDITPLSGLSNLVQLSLTSNYIKDLTPLSSCAKLEHLDLSDNDISDLAALKNLVLLETLNVSNNQLTTLAGLETLQTIKTLYCRNNALTTLNPIHTLTPENLDIARNYLTDISELSFGKMKYLDLSENEITSIAALSAAPNLITLNCGDNMITNIDSLAGHNILTSLNLNRNQITDLSALRDCVILQTLECSDQEISDFSVLAALTTLSSLNISGTQGYDFSFLRNLTNLKALNLNQCSFYSDDISYLTKELTVLNLSGTQISTVQKLSEFANLTDLNLSNSQVKYVNDLTGLSKLQVLNLDELNLENSDANSTALTSLQTIPGFTQKKSTQAVQGIYFLQDVVETMEQEQIEQSVSFLPANSAHSNVTWTSSDPKIATVQDGIVSAIAPGTTTITVATNDGAFQESYQLHVAKAMIKDVKVVNQHIEFSVTNITQKNYLSAKVLIAVSDAGILQETSIVAIQDFNANTTTNIALDIDKIGKNKTIRIILLEDTNSLTPICPAKTVNVE